MKKRKNIQVVSVTSGKLQFLVIFLKKVTETKPITVPEFFNGTKTSYSPGEDPFGLNLGGFYYEIVSSPFLLWKIDLDVLSGIVFNSCYRHVLPLLVPNSSYDEFETSRGKTCW